MRTLFRTDSTPRTSSLGLRCSWAADSLHALPKSFFLLGGHVLPALCHAIGHAISDATADFRAIGAMPPSSAEENPAQYQKSKPLPQSDRAPAEERRQQPVPQVHHNLATDVGKE